MVKEKGTWLWTVTSGFPVPRKSGALLSVVQLLAKPVSLCISPVPQEATSFLLQFFLF